ncbi:helix-turn-helix domain-containing protein [Lactobacillus salivarius]|uniref:XRE family transcriptional regulator n=1 Tax=Ligilactobacillus salivarius TaxID=1624 RepID=UPI0014742590|nr:XRE family transcriptional regulator [Ligilactobacillus salivarius]NME23715.1 helix-turn-helix domain-containing protein [Ligilactobacillus salivarius]
MVKSTLGNKKIMASNIRRNLDKLGLNTKEFSNKLDFKYTTVLDWVNAKTYPRIDKIEKMANFFGIEKSELVEEFNEDNTYLNRLNNTVMQLNTDNKKKVVDYADNKLKDQMRQSKIHPINENNNTYYVDVLGSVSAGTGEWLTDEQHEEVMVNNEPPAHDFALRVNGDSMTPAFSDGQIIYVNKIYDTEEVRNNQFVVAELNGDAYVKKIVFDDDKKNCRLISLNKKYADIEIKKSDDFKIVGVVII